MSYVFIHFILMHPKAIALRIYLKGVVLAEKHFYITLFHLPEAPVGKSPIHQISSTRIWMFSDNSHLKCNAAERHHVCIAGVGTMKSIHKSSTFFFNNYSEELDHIIMDCAEKRIVQKNIQEYSKDCCE